MTETEIARIEAALGLSLPSEYRAFLANDADEVRRFKELLPLRAVLWTSADDIIRGNEEARSYAADMTIGEDEENQQAWPEGYLVVGTNGGGDFWFVHRDGVEAGVWFWQHEEHRVVQVCSSFAEYMQRLRRDANEPKKWQ